MAITFTNLRIRENKRTRRARSRCVIPIIQWADSISGDEMKMNFVREHVFIIQKHSRLNGIGRARSDVHRDVGKPFCFGRMVFCQRSGALRTFDRPSRRISHRYIDGPVFQTEKKMKGKRFDGSSYFFLRRTSKAPRAAMAMTIAMMATRDMSGPVSEGMYTVSGSDGTPIPIKFTATTS